MKTHILILTLVISSAFTHAETNNPQFILKRGDIPKVSVNLDFEGTSEITLTLSKEKQTSLEKFTEENIGKKIEVIIDGKIVSSPVVRAVITGPTLQISSNTPSEALKIAEALIPEKK